MEVVTKVDVVDERQTFCLAWQPYLDCPLEEADFEALWKLPTYGTRQPRHADGLVFSEVRQGGIFRQYENVEAGAFLHAMKREAPGPRAFARVIRETDLITQNYARTVIQQFLWTNARCFDRRHYDASERLHEIERRIRVYKDGVASLKHGKVRRDYWGSMPKDPTGDRTALFDAPHASALRQVAWAERSAIRAGSVRLLLTLACCTLALGRMYADVTNEVDVAALAAFGNDGAGVTNGWTVSGIDSYSGKPNFRLSEKADFVCSPDFGAAIVRLVLKVKSSAVADRRLAFQPWNGTAYDEASALLCDYSPNKDTYVDQMLEATNAVSFSRFRIALSGSGNTGWGVNQLWAVTRDPLGAPQGLTVLKAAARFCTLGCERGIGAVSNEIEVLRLDWSPDAEETCFVTDFDELSAGGNPRNYTSSIPQLYPGFGGELLYAPVNTNGILQISNGKERGVLTYAGLSDFARTRLRMRVKRYPEDGAVLSVAWTDGAVTNEIGTLTLTDDFEWREMALDSVLSGARLLVGYNRDGVAGNRRVLLDALEIVRLGAYVESVVGSFSVSAADGSSRISTRPHIRLQPKTRYRFRVSSVSVDHRRSPSVSVEATTTDETGGMLYIR